MSILQPILKEDIQLPLKPPGKKLVSIFDSSHYKKQTNLDLHPNIEKNRSFSNEKEIKELSNIEQSNQIENKIEDEAEEEFYNTKVTKIVHEIMKHRILIKLKKNIMSLVDGKIILFSDLIKIMCSYNSFNYRINLDELDRDNLEKILDYLDIIEWNKSRYMWENKEDELNNWFHCIENLFEFERVINKIIKNNFFLNNRFELKD